MVVPGIRRNGGRSRPAAAASVDGTVRL